MQAVVSPSAEELQTRIDGTLGPRQALLLEILEAPEQGVEARFGLFEGGLLRIEGQQIARVRLPPEHLEPVAFLARAEVDRNSMR